MKKFLYLAIFVAILSACAEETADEGNNDGQLANISISTKAIGSTGEDPITSVRLVMFNASGEVVFNDDYASTTEINGVTKYIFKRVLTTAKTAYIVCNETPALRAALKGVRSVAQLEQVVVDAINTQPPLFVLFGKTTGIVLTTNKEEDTYLVDYKNDMGTVLTRQSELVVAVKRLAVKVSMNLVKDNPMFTLSNFEFTAKRIPTYSYLGESKPYTSTTVTEKKIEIATGSNPSLITDGSYNMTADPISITGERITTVDFYLPEHILSNPSENNQATYIEVKAKALVNGSQTQDVLYRVFLKADATYPGYNNYNTPRNTWYKVYATIQNLSDAGIFAKVVPFDEHRVNVGWAALDGLAIVSDKVADYNGNRDIWNDVNTYSGILMVRKKEVGVVTYNEVVFKYGSAVAIQSNTADAYSHSHILWQPYGGTLYQTWEDIPSTSTTEDWHNNSNADLVKAGKGDPCKLVGLTEDQINRGIVNNNLWHMATAEELSWLVSENDGIYDAQNNTYDTRGYKTYHTYMIPNRAFRNETGQRQGASNGYFWASTYQQLFMSSAGDSKVTNNAQMILTPTAHQYASAYSIRCVRNDIPETILTAAGSEYRYNISSTTAGTKQSPPQVSTQTAIQTSNVYTNAPFWCAELLTTASEKGSGEITGTNTLGLPHFVFTTRQSTGSLANSPYIVYGITASNHNSINYQLGFWPTHLEPRTYKIKYTARGHRGDVKEQTIALTQRGYYWKVVTSNNLNMPIWTSGASIPNAGQTYSNAKATIWATDHSYGGNYTDISFGSLQPKVFIRALDRTTLLQTGSLVPVNAPGTEVTCSITIPSYAGATENRQLVIQALSEGLPDQPDRYVWPNTNMVPPYMQLAPGPVQIK